MSSYLTGNVTGNGHFGSMGLLWEEFAENSSHLYLTRIMDAHVLMGKRSADHTILSHCVSASLCVNQRWGS